MGASPKKKSPAGTIIFLCLFAAVVVGGFLMLTRNKDKGTAEIPAESSETDILIKKDLIFDYPATPREVLKLYCRITMCLYNEDLTDTQRKKLVGQLRGLYSSELLAINPEDEQISLLKGDREEYKKANKTIFQYKISKADDIRYIDSKGGKTAIVQMVFTTKAGGNLDRVFEEFSLIRDDNDHWKIMGWQKMENELNIEDEE